MKIFNDEIRKLKVHVNNIYNTHTTPSHPNKPKQ